MATSKNRNAGLPVAVGDSPRHFVLPWESANERDRAQVVFDSKGNSNSVQQTRPCEQGQVYASESEDENLTVVCVDGVPST